MTDHDRARRAGRLFRHGAGLVQNFHPSVVRCTTSAFPRTKSGGALEQCAVAPYIHESADEAQAHLHGLESAER